MSAPVACMTHPGYCDAALSAISTYAAGRETERAVLCDPDLPVALAARDIIVVGPGEIAGRAGASR